MTIRQGTYWHATSCVGHAEDTTKLLMSFFLARFPGMTNGGTYGCRYIADTTILSTHATGRTGDTMTGTGKPTVDSLFLVEQMRVFSFELGIQGLIHNRRQFFCNLGPNFEKYNGSNPHENHIHWERIPGKALTENQIRSVFIGPAITGNKLTAGKMLKLGDRDGDGATWGSVHYVQTRLNMHGMWNVAVDGVYGPITQATVKLFQHLCGIEEDGVAGPVTQGRMQ